MPIALNLWSRFWSVFVASADERVRTTVTPPRRRRGYLLLEAGIAGAIVAAGLGGAVVALGAAETKVSHNARQATAASLVAGALEAQRSRPVSELVPGETVTPRLEGLRGGYRQTVTITKGSETIEGKSFGFARIDVEIACLDEQCQATASTRLYE